MFCLPFLGDGRRRVINSLGAGTRAARRLSEPSRQSRRADSLSPAAPAAPGRPLPLPLPVPLSPGGPRPRRRTLTDTDVRPLLIGACPPGWRAAEWPSLGVQVGSGAGVGVGRTRAVHTGGAEPRSGRRARAEAGLRTWLCRAYLDPRKGVIPPVSARRGRRGPWLAGTSCSCLQTPRVSVPSPANGDEVTPPRSTRGAGVRVV